MSASSFFFVILERCDSQQVTDIFDDVESPEIRCPVCNASGRCLCVDLSPDQFYWTRAYHVYWCPKCGFSSSLHESEEECRLEWDTVRQVRTLAEIEKRFPGSVHFSSRKHKDHPGR